jgi:hypothetical protein
MPIASIRRIAVAASVAALVAVPTATSVAFADHHPDPSHGVSHHDPSYRGDHLNPPHPYPPKGRLYVTQRTYACGRLSYIGSGFVPREAVQVKLDSLVLDLDQANRRGVVSGDVRVPCDTSPGSHVFSLTGQSSGQFLSAKIKVTRFHQPRAGSANSVRIDTAPMSDHVIEAETTPESTVPANAMPAAGAAAALGLLGGGTYLVLRRRRRADDRRG